MGAPQVVPPTAAASEPAPRAGLARALGDSLWAFLAALTALAVADSILAWGRSGASAGLVLHYLGVTIACGSWLALLLGAPTALGLFAARNSQGIRRGSPFFRALVGTTAASLFAAAIALLLLKPWDLGLTWPYVVVPGLGLLAALGLALVERFTAGNLRRLVYIALALCAFALDAVAYRRLYLALHNVLFFVAVLLLARAAALPSDLSTRVKVASAAAVLVLSHLTLFGDLATVRHVGVWFGTVQAKTLAVVHTLSDSDGDGHSAVFGGGDCDDANPAVHPGACEVPASGRDDNCNGARSDKNVGAHDQPPAWTQAPGQPRRPDIYFVMVDTLRGDFGGTPRAAVAPELEAFAGTALDFRRAYTPYPSTFRAMLSLSRSRSWRGIEGGTSQLMGILMGLGYDARLSIGERTYRRTAAGGPVVNLDRSKGDPFELDGHERKGEWSRAIFTEAIAELSLPSDAPRFRWLHLLDPHAPLVRGQGTPLERYRAEVRHMSLLFGELTAALAKTERGRQAVVIFLSDHGEEYEDHGGRFHGATLYQENIWVPLLIRLPGVPPAQVDQLASLVDILPTLADYLGQPRNPAWQGYSWLRPVPTDRVVFSQIEPVANLGGQGRPAMHAVLSGGYKLIHDVTKNLFELYDLGQDPEERRSLMASKPEEAARLRRLLARWQDDPVCQSF